MNKGLDINERVVMVATFEKLLLCSPYQQVSRSPKINGYPEFYVGYTEGKPTILRLEKDTSVMSVIKVCGQNPMDTWPEKPSTNIVIQGMVLPNEPGYINLLNEYNKGALA